MFHFKLIERSYISQYIPKNVSIEMINFFLNDPDIILHKFDYRFFLSFSSSNNLLDIVELLLKNKNVNPADSSNEAITFACISGNYNAIALLWNDIRVKNTLKIDNLMLYNKLVKEDIKNKVGKF